MQEGNIEKMLLLAVKRPYLLQWKKGTLILMIKDVLNWLH